MKIAILVTHLLGTGHLVRAIALARAIKAFGDEPIVLSGGFPTPHLANDTIPFVQLPPVRSNGVDFRTLLTDGGAVANATLWEARKDILAKTLAKYAPDILITELWPFGRRSLGAEFLYALALASPAKIVCSIRDILSSPSTDEKRRATEKIIHDRFEAVFVHSDPRITPLEMSWPVSETLAKKLIYTGFITPQLNEEGEYKRTNDVLVAAGGGPVGEELFLAALQAAPAVPQLNWRLLVGGGDARIRHLSAHIVSANATVEPPRRDYRKWLRVAACSVSQAGYNTALDVIQAKTPAVFAPFEDGGETEQRLRAEALKKNIGALVLSKSDLSGASLASAVRAAVERAPLHDFTAKLDGAPETARLLRSL